MDVKSLLFVLADLSMIVAGYTYGIRFIRNYRNYLLGLEWIIVASSGVNFLIWALLGGPETSPMFDLAIFLDAFSRSVGITLILVVGLMKVTHGFRPSVAVDVAVFGLAIAAGLLLAQLGGHPDAAAGPPPINVPIATFYVVVNLVTTVFLLYFAWRLWRVDARSHALGVVAVTIAGTVIAAIYDFYPIPGDDAHKTILYILALSTWASQMVVYYYGYRALHDGNERAVQRSALEAHR